jgi:hypothetical protein
MMGATLVSAFCMNILMLALPYDRPLYTHTAGLIGATPGLSIYPNPLRAAETNKKNDTLVKIAKLAVIYSYKQLGAPTK